MKKKTQILKLFKFLYRKFGAFKDILKSPFFQGNAGVHRNNRITAVRTTKNKMRTGFTNDYQAGFLKLFKSFPSSNNRQFSHLGKPDCLRKLNRNVQKIIILGCLQGKRIIMLYHGFNHAFNSIFNTSYCCSIGLSLSCTTRKQRTISVIAAFFSRLDNGHKFIVSSLNYFFHLIREKVAQIFKNFNLQTVCPPSAIRRLAEAEAD